MKIRLNVRSEVYDALAAELAAHGIELSYDAQLMLSEVNQYPDYLSGKLGGESYHIAVSKVVWIETPSVTRTRPQTGCGSWRRALTQSNFSASPTLSSWRGERFKKFGHPCPPNLCSP